jgi:hypothetical protein
MLNSVLFSNAVYNFMSTGKRRPWTEGESERTIADLNRGVTADGRLEKVGVILGVCMRNTAKAFIRFRPSQQKTKWAASV